MFVITDWGRVVETVILFAAFAPPAEFRAFDPPAAQVLPAGPTLNAEGIPVDPAPPGREWQRWPGENWKLVKVTAAPGVAAPQPFRGTADLGKRPGLHHCPVCGVECTVQTGDGPARNSHYHECPGHARWWH
jgi:hypothetical protein